MNEQTQNHPAKLTPERKVWVWQYVVRCIDKAQGPDERKADAYKLVNQQLRDASDAGGKP